MLILFFSISFTFIIIFLLCICHVFYNYDKEVIFGLISQLSVAKTQYFFKSLEKVKYKGKIIIFVDKKQNIKYYKNLKIDYLLFSKRYPYYPVNNKKYHINLSFINSIYPYFNESIKHIHFLWIIRYYLIYSYISFYGSDKDSYLLSDIRDVIFQKNPFNWKFNKGIYLVEESKLKSLKEVSFEWMKLYTINDTILKQKVINGGIMFGTHKEIKSFLKEFLKGYYKEGKNGVDQAYLNYFIYTKSIFHYPLYICESNKCFCKCLIQEIMFSKELIINERDMMIYNTDHSVPCLIHQYTQIYKTNSTYRINLFQSYIKMLTE